MQEVDSPRKQPSFHMVSALMEIPSFYGVVRTKVIFSSDPRCDMEIQRLEEVHDDTTALNGKMDGSATRTNLRKDGISTHLDHEDGYPADLVSKFDTEEGPEVFKRVRFLSRWEFRRESRGCLFSKIGHYNWWLADCPEALAMNVTLGNAFRESSDVPLWFRPGAGFAEIIVLFGVFFVGLTLQQSRPVLVMFSMTKKARREAWKFCTGIDWIRANPSLILLTSWHSIFHPVIRLARKRLYGTRFLEDSWKTSEDCAKLV
jgi:hypothetical protein